MLHYKLRLGVLAAAEQVTLERDTLADQGTAVVSIKARESVPNGDLVGVTVDLGPRATTSPARARTRATSRRSSTARTAPAAYPGYRVEVVDRVGNDSFAPGHGVLLSKSRTRARRRCG